MSYQENEGMPRKKILSIEDNVDDIVLIKRAHKKFEDKFDLFTAQCYEDAKKAINDQNNNFCLILIDINLPRKNGLEILKELKIAAATKDIPICILTTSKWEEDVKKAYKYGCNAYIEKPFDYKEFIGVVEIIFSFWLINHPPD